MKTKQGACYCTRTAKKRKYGAWCCPICDERETKMKTETGSHLIGKRIAYSELDFRGRVFSR